LENKLKNIFRNKNILVTGGTGCIGSEIVRRLIPYKPKVIRIFSNDEDNTFRMMHELGGDGSSKTMQEFGNKRFLIGDIRDKERVMLAMEGMDIVYHAAALKHVPLCEYNPFEAIKTNVLGTQNVIDAALSNEVEKVIGISSDKAVSPVNTMGATKLLSEHLITDVNRYKGHRKTIFSCVRFGNVLFSRGSVIPLFEKQILEKKEITITNPDMTRFMMSISDTINLIFKATLLARGGENFILKMPVIKLGDLAESVIDIYSDKYGLNKKEIKKKVIGLRPGEKMYEELMTETEAKYAFETDDMLIIPPQVELPGIKFTISDYPKAKICKLTRYSSKNVKPITIKKVKEFISKTL